MEIKIEKIYDEKNSELRIIVPIEKNLWKEEQTKSFNNLSKKLKLKGYRTGKVPTEIAKKMILPNQIWEDAISRLLNVAVDTVAKVARGERPRLKGKHYAYLDNDNKPITEIINFNARTNSKRVKCIELDKIYNSAKEASDELGFSRNAVSLCCRGYSETCGGYHWQYIESEVA